MDLHGSRWLQLNKRKPKGWE
uniref:Uncharacterized protein n=1 Tax=Rhizophora mucronata TaxID=61149 RepID=A0A2P2NDU1_RHIMU